MKALLTVEQLATFLNKSPNSVRCDATRNPRSLPPICRLPGTNRLLWRVEDVEEWIAQHVQAPKLLPAPCRPVADKAPAPVVHPPKRGRPTKAERLARQAQGLGAKTKTAEQG